MEKDIIKMNKREIDRLGVIQEVINKRTGQKETTRIFSLSTRQVLVRFYPAETTGAAM